MCDAEEAHVCGIPVLQGDGVEVDAVVRRRRRSRRIRVVDDPEVINYC